MQNKFFQPKSNFMGQNNIDNAFQSNTPIIDRTNFVNQKNFLHNNMNDILLHERLVEYNIHIDSIDRNTDYFPSPFNFRLTLGEPSTSIESKTSTRNIAYPNINRYFKNVKYVALDAVILPNVISIDTTHLPDLYPANSVYMPAPTPIPEIISNTFFKLRNCRYLILKIKELDNDNILGTSSQLDRNVFVLIPHEYSGSDHSIWVPVQKTIVFNTSKLMNIDKLTFVLCDDMGNEIKIKNNTDGSNFLISGSTFTEYAKLHNDLATVEYTNRHMQSTYIMTIGRIENEMNTLVGYT